MAKRNTKEQAKPRVIDVEFAINAPEAQIVCLAGSFNKWCTESLPLRRNGNGQWRLKLPLPPGCHEYKFVVDGNWIHDPKAVEQMANCFGSLNSFVLVEHA